MAIQQIIGAIINDEHITTDRNEIEAARRSGHGIKYVTRDRAKLLACQTRSPDWADLASSKTLFLIVDGQHYEPNRATGQGAPVHAPTYAADMPLYEPAAA